VGFLERSPLRSDLGHITFVHHRGIAMTNTIDSNEAARDRPVRFCPSCGVAAGSGAFCAACGKPLSDASPAASIPAAVQPTRGTVPSAVPDAGPAGRPNQPTEYVRAMAVATETAEYVDVAGIGVVKLATIGQRVLARLLDFVVVTVGYWLIVGFFAIIGAILAAVSGGTAAVNNYDSYGAGLAQAGSVLGSLLAGLFFAAVLAYVYEIAMTTLWGRTVGKMIVGARIVRTADGRKPNLGNSFLRWLAPGLGALIPFLGSLGSLLVLLSPTFDSSGRRQGWHDKMASTLVIEAPKSITKNTGSALVKSVKSAADSLRTEPPK
jgi:uncharacterized RDD family membrane protein YckC